MTRSISLTAGLLVCGVIAWGAVLAPRSVEAGPIILFQETFESYTAVAGTGGDDGDNDPGNPPEDDPINTASWSFPIGETAPTDVQVTASPSTNGLGANEQVLTMSSPGTNLGLVQRSAAILPGSTRVKLKMRPNEVAPDDTNNAGARIVVLGADSGDIMFFDMRQTLTGSSPGIGAFFGSSPGVGTTGVSLIPVLTAGAWYEAVLDMHFGSQTFDVTVTNLDNPAESGSWSNAPFRFLNDAVGGIRLSRAGNAEFQNASFDDILMFVPEPAAAGLLVLGTLALVRRRTR